MSHLRFVYQCLLTRAGKGRELDSSGETLVTLGVVVLEADLELDGLEEVPLLGLVGVLEELLNVRTNAGDRDFRHVGNVSPRGYSVPLVALRWCWLRKRESEGGAHLAARSVRASEPALGRVSSTDRW